MNRDEFGPIDWNNPIPGEVQAIQYEIDRITEIRDRCRDTAQKFRTLNLDEWTGQAADQFEEFKSTRLARQWDEMEDEHDLLITALVDYQDTLLTLQPLANHAVEQATYEGTYAQAEADVLRWREQANAAARQTADKLRAVASRLRALPALSDDRAVVGTGPNGQSLPSQRPHDISTNGTASSYNGEPSAQRQSPASLNEQVISLCDALLTADYVSEEHL